MKDLKKLIICVLIPLGLGIIVGILTTNMNSYMQMNMPSFAPPAILFPIVWTILYILMGISCYLVIESIYFNKEEALIIYGVQLLVNLLWSFIFFSFKAYLLAFIWIILLIILVAIMIIKFYQINKISAYLQIPYLIWLIFAAILNLSIYLIN